MKKGFFTIFILLLVLSLVACKTNEGEETVTPPAKTANDDKDINEIVVHAKSGEKPEDFVFEPAEIKVKVGEKVKISLKSDDTPIHVLSLPSIKDGRIKEDESIIFFSNEPGEFLGNCIELCGPGHGLMNFKIIVE